MCPCGGQPVKASEQSNGLRITYLKCPSCGRCGNWAISVSDKQLTGIEARRFYRRQITQKNPVG